MKTPPPLNPGATIAIMAPSSRIAPEDLDASVDLLKARGYTVVVHPQCYAGKGPSQFAGTVAEKVSALHDLAHDPKINAVFFATGGTRCMTILDHLDYDLIAAVPKIYLGFSDHTALLNAITARTGLVTYHGPTLKRLPKNPQIDFNLRLLAGQEKTILLGGATILRDGKAEGKLFGGNLAVFRAMNDRDMIAPDGNILFLEEIKEELSTIDRDLCALRRSGLFDRVSAIIFGQFTDMGDNGTPFGMTLEEIVREHTAGLSIPVLMNAPFGHDVNLPVFPVGAKVRLENAALQL